MKLLNLILTWAILALSLLFPPQAQAQDLAQHSGRGRISGYVKSQGSERPLVGVLVEILNMQPRQAALTDSLGFFAFEELPTGRYRLLISLEGYEQELIPDVISAAGQLASLEILMSRQAVLNLSTKLDSLGSKKILSSRDRPYNLFSALATRPFTPEEVLRYAGARFDPALLVTNFAGVTSYDDARNDIVIRGNSPSLLLWQIEELPIENPNHVTSIGTAGGALPILSMYTIGRADFSKGLLSAQYGNALSGVFDLSLREGNRNRLGAMAMLGLQRVEGLLEGPIKGGGSFLIGARGSGLSQLQSGLIPTDPLHQDLSFKIKLGDKRWGSLEFFGLGGRSLVSIPYTEDNIVDKIRYQIFEFEDFEHSNQMGLIGSKYSLKLGQNSLFRQVIGLSYHGNRSVWELNDLSDSNNIQILPSYFIQNRRLAYLSHSYVQGKAVGDRLDWRLGLMFKGNQLNLSEYWGEGEEPDTDFQGFHFSTNLYAQVRWALNTKFFLFAGISGMYNSFNGEINADPNLSLQWNLAPGHSLSLGAGLNHRMPNIQNLYFNPVVGYDSVGTPLLDYQGRRLGNQRSLKMDLEYNWAINQSWRLKTQAYWQEIDRAFVEDATWGNPIFSMLNNENTFFAFYYEALQNRGRGRNRGLELSVEHFFTKGFYGLFSATVFESLYTGGDGQWRPTVFDNRYILNLLMGKEWNFGKQRQHVAFADLRLATRGGRPYRPIDAEATYQEGFQNGYLEPVYDDEKAFLVRTPAFYQVDVKLGVRLNSSKRKLTQTIRLDLFNVFNIRNVFTYQYSAVFNPFGQPEPGNVLPIYQRGFIPDLTYMIQF